jgi:hypothetical protein
MDNEQAPSRQVGESERVPLAEGILCEPHGISIADAVILLAAMTDAAARPRPPWRPRSSTVDPGSYPTPYGTAFVEPRYDDPRKTPHVTTNG